MHTPDAPASVMERELMQDVLLEAVLTPEDCLRAAAAPADPELTAAWRAAQAQDLPQFSQQARCGLELLSQGTENAWLRERLLERLKLANDEAYGFALDGLGELMRLSFGPGDYWNWHLDLGMGAFSLRKLSLLVCLDPPEAYAGGAFGMVMSRREAAPLLAGQGLVFPAYCMSRLWPVEKGRCRLLMAWGQGQEAFS